MVSLSTALAEILHTVQRPGDFVTAGRLDIFMPALDVDGVGPLALPLLPVQAQQLIAVAEQAPYGKGKATLVDTAVRRTWQIGAERVRISGRHWEQTLTDIVTQVAAGLGVSGPIEADLYKLLVYDTGSFFVSHRDTEKTAGMFATLILVLPSLYSGGDLVVRHRGREVRCALSCPEASQVAFAAFYADCVHEVLPITSGYRLALVYNLKRQGRGPQPEAPNYDAEQASVVALLQQWSAASDRLDDTPDKLLYPLEHAYTPAELSFAALKGTDAAVAAVLVTAAAAAACDLHLALVSIEESGSAEYLGSYRARRRWQDEDEEDDFEVGEVYDRSETLSNWCRPDGSQAALGALPFEPEELCPPDAFADLEEPDEQHFHEATGNEGASFERTYRRAALVLWPGARRLAVLNQAGLAATLPYLSELTRRWAEAGADPASALWQEAHILSGHMLHTWPAQRSWYPGASETPSEAATLLSLLCQLQDVGRIATCLEVLASSAYRQTDNAAIIQAAGLLPPEQAVALLAQLIAAQAPLDLRACSDLLARSVAAQVSGQAADLGPAASALVEALPGAVARSAPRDPWRPTRPPVEPECLVALLPALEQINAALADRAVERILAWPLTYALDAVVVPAVLGLLEQSQAGSALQRLRAAALEHLRTRIALPLEPPRDWTRASTIACTCAHCRELSQFLADPARQRWVFKAPEAGRRHVEESIRQSDCDLNLTTERRGRPYSLVCTKNQASYDRRAQQRQQDLHYLARLDGSQS
ncbi:MAG: 2OG-Fe(II) oxygenase [Candidatus Tectimicrobiota bacterium]